MTDDQNPKQLPPFSAPASFVYPPFVIPTGARLARGRAAAVLLAAGLNPSEFLRPEPDPLVPGGDPLKE